jgi:hypothetical protein
MDSATAQGLPSAVAAAAALWACIYQHKVSVRLFLVWIIWLLVGGTFYAESLGVGWGRGFYQAVSVGYSIGWGDVSEAADEDSQGFSICYLSCGASFVGVAFGTFGNYISKERDNWYENELQRISLNEYKKTNFLKYMVYWTYMNREVLFVVFIWLIFVFFGAGMALYFHEDDGWGFTNSLYFAISSLSTGGLYAIEEHAEEWEYGLIAAYCAVGIPVMGAAMAGLASLFLDLGSVDQACKEIRHPISEEEVNMLGALGIADSIEELDKLEFLVLCIVRIGSVSPDLVKFILEYFQELDTDHSGKLSIIELTNRFKSTQAAMSDRLLSAAKEQSARQLSASSLLAATNLWKGESAKMNSKLSAKMTSVSAFNKGLTSKSLKSELNNISSLTAGSEEPLPKSPSKKLSDLLGKAPKVVPDESLPNESGNAENPVAGSNNASRDAEQCQHERKGDVDWRKTSPMTFLP